MAQLEESLPCKHEDLGEIPRTHILKLGMFVSACNSCPRKAEMGGFLGTIGSQQLTGQDPG